MKRLATFCLLASSLVFVGCNNYLAGKSMEDLLKDFDGATICPGEGLIPENLANISVEKTVIQCERFEDLLVVEERTHEGWNRVVLKAPVINTYNRGIIGDWYYIGVDLSHEQYDEWLKLNEQGKEDLLLNILFDGVIKYGYLRYEPRDNDFFFMNDEGGWEIFSENIASIKDVELMGTKVEDQNAVTLGEKLSAQYGLSSDRGQVVAKTIATYNNLASKRSLTAEEKDQFTNALLGVDYKTAERGIGSGDAKEFENLMERAAKTNGITPEAVSAIIKDMVL